MIDLRKIISLILVISLLLSSNVPAFAQLDKKSINERMLDMYTLVSGEIEKSKIEEEKAKYLESLQILWAKRWDIIQELNQAENTGKLSETVEQTKRILYPFYKESIEEKGKGYNWSKYFKEPGSLYAYLLLHRIDSSVRDGIYFVGAKNEKDLERESEISVRNLFIMGSSANDVKNTEEEKNGNAIYEAILQLGYLASLEDKACWNRSETIRKETEIFAGAEGKNENEIKKILDADMEYQVCKRTKGYDNAVLVRRGKEIEKYADISAARAARCVRQVLMEMQAAPYDIAFGEIAGYVTKRAGKLNWEECGVSKEEGINLVLAGVMTEEEADRAAKNVQNPENFWNRIFIDSWKYLSTSHYMQRADAIKEIENKYPKESKELNGNDKNRAAIRGVFLSQSLNANLVKIAANLLLYGQVFSYGGGIRLYESQFRDELYAIGIGDQDREINGEEHLYIGTPISGLARGIIHEGGFSFSKTLKRELFEREEKLKFLNNSEEAAGAFLSAFDFMVMMLGFDILGEMRIVSKIWGAIEKTNFGKYLSKAGQGIRDVKYTAGDWLGEALGIPGYGEKYWQALEIANKATKPAITEATKAATATKETLKTTQEIWNPGIVEIDGKSYIYNIQTGQLNNPIPVRETPTSLTTTIGEGGGGAMATRGGNRGALNKFRSRKGDVRIGGANKGKTGYYINAERANAYDAQIRAMEQETANAIANYKPNNVFNKSYSQMNWFERFATNSDARIEYLWRNVRDAFTGAAKNPGRTLTSVATFNVGEAPAVVTRAPVEIVQTVKTNPITLYDTKQIAGSIPLPRANNWAPKTAPLFSIPKFNLTTVMPFAALKILPSDPPLLKQKKLELRREIGGLAAATLAGLMVSNAVAPIGVESMVNDLMAPLTNLLNNANPFALTMAAPLISKGLNIETVYGPTMSFTDYLPEWKDKLPSFTAKEFAAFERAVALTDKKFDDPNFDQWSYETILEENLNNVLHTKNISLKNNKRFQVLDKMNLSGFQTYYKYRSYIKFLQLYKRNPGNNKDTPTKERGLAIAIKRIKDDPRTGYPLIQELNDLWANNANAKKNKSMEILLSNKEEYEEFTATYGRNPNAKSEDDYERALAMAITHILYDDKAQETAVGQEIKERWAQFSKQRKSDESLADLIRFHETHYGINPSGASKDKYERALANNIDYLLHKKSNDDTNIESIRQLWEDHAQAKKENFYQIRLNEYKDFVAKNGRNPSQHINEERGLTFSLLNIIESGDKDNQYVKELTAMWRELSPRKNTKETRNQETLNLIASIKTFVENNGRLPAKNSKITDESALAKAYYTAANPYYNIDENIRQELSALWANNANTQEQAIKETPVQENISAEETNSAKRDISYWFDTYTKFLEENGRNPKLTSKNQAEKQLAHRIAHIRDLYKDRPLGQQVIELWDRYDQQKKDNRIETIYLKMKQFTEENGRNPKQNKTDPQESTLSVQISAIKTNNDITSPYRQKIIDLWNEYDQKAKVARLTGLYNEIQDFVDKNGRVPNSNATDPEELRLKRAYFNAINSYSDDYQIIVDLKTLWANSKVTAVPQEETAPQQAAAPAEQTGGKVLSRKQQLELEKQNNYLERYKNFLKENNRNPYQAAQDEDESSLAKYIQNSVFRRGAQNNPVINQFKALWQLHDTGRHTKKQKTPDEWAAEYRQFLQENKRNPFMTANAPKEERVLGINIKNIIKENATPSLTHELKGLWALNSKTPQQEHTTSAEDWLTMYAAFTAQYDRKPMPEADKLRERNIALAAEYLFENTPADSPLRTKFRELFDDFEPNEDDLVCEADYAEEYAYSDEEDEEITPKKKHNGKEATLAELYTQYLIANNIAQDEAVTLPQTQTEKEAFAAAYKQFVNENNRLPSLFTADNQERTLALTLKYLKSDLDKIENYVTVLLALERKFPQQDTTAKLYEQFIRYAAQNKVLPKENSKLYQAVSARLRYGTKDAKDIEDLGLLFAFFRISDAVNKGQVTWDDNLEMQISSDIETKAGISAQEVNALYTAMPIQDRRILRDMADNYQEIANNFPVWLEQNSQNIVWDNKTAQALNQLKADIQAGKQNAYNILAAISQMSLGQAGFGPHYLLIFRGQNPAALTADGFHVILERPGVMFFEEPATQNITFQKEMGKLTGLVLSAQTSAQDITQTLNQLTKNGSYTLRITKHDLGMQDGKPTQQGLDGKLQIHLEKVFPFADDAGYYTDASVLISVDASTLTSGKTEAEIISIYNNLFSAFTEF